MKPRIAAVLGRIFAPSEAIFLPKILHVVANKGSRATAFSVIFFRYPSFDAVYQ
jgi:hypothetical protein